MIKVIIKNEKEVNAARNWCEENFGEIPIKKIRKRRGLIRAYDNKNARWLHWYTKDKYTFYFRENIDAITFKLSKPWN